MKRKIKFRVWSNQLSKWITDYVITDYNLSAVTINHIFNHTELDNEDIIFQQFTGLEDKNGKDIYEGDIIQQLSFEDWGDDDGDILNRDVQFKTYDTSYGFYESGWYFGAYGKIEKDCEVIGNIFENPELLK